VVRLDPTTRPYQGPLCRDMMSVNGSEIGVNTIGLASNEDPRANWIPSETFARYAETDLDRWRQIVGQRVEHVDSRWGIGVVESVSWGSCCDHVPAYVQVKIRYEAGWAVVAHSETWHRHHRSIAVPDSVKAVIEACFEPDLSDEECDECLRRHTRELRERRDHEMLDRAARMKQRALDDRDPGSSNADQPAEFND